jgi:hypothetical protein
MERDHGWIHTLIEVSKYCFLPIKIKINDSLQEAEDERMHLMTFLQLRHPGPLF